MIYTAWIKDDLYSHISNPSCLLVFFDFRRENSTTRKAAVIADPLPVGRVFEKFQSFKWNEWTFRLQYKQRNVASTNEEDFCPKGSGQAAAMAMSPSGKRTVINSMRLSQNLGTNHVS